MRKCHCRFGCARGISAIFSALQAHDFTSEVLVQNVQDQLLTPAEAQVLRSYTVMFSQLGGASGHKTDRNLSC